MPKSFLSVSTKTGDRGESGLANGQRVEKDALIFEVLGTQDELNSWLGLCLAKLSGHFDEQKRVLLAVQEALFYLGAELAGSAKAKLTKKQLENLEEHSERLQRTMEEGWTTKFLYPGGNEAAACVDVARTISRRFERVVVQYSKTSPTSPTILQYVNRLSDYLYVLRCWVNHEERVEEKSFEVKK